MGTRQRISAPHKRVSTPPLQPRLRHITARDKLYELPLDHLLALFGQIGGDISYPVASASSEHLDDALLTDAYWTSNRRYYTCLFSVLNSAFVRYGERVLYVLYAACRDRDTRRAYLDEIFARKRHAFGERRAAG